MKNLTLAIGAACMVGLLAASALGAVGHGEDIRSLAVQRGSRSDGRI